MVAGVAEVVEVDAGQAGSNKCPRPGSAPEVAMSQELPARGGEQERVGARGCVGVEMVLDLSHAGAGQNDLAFACGCFRGREERRLAAGFGELAGDAHGPGGGVYVAAAERCQPAPGQAAEAGEHEPGAVTGAAGIG